MQDACGTCDADCSVICKALQQAGLNPATTQVLVLHPKSLAEVLHGILAICHAAGAVETATELATQLLQRLARVAARVAAACPAAAADTAACTASTYVLPGRDAAAAAVVKGGSSGEPSVMNQGCNSLQPIQQQQQRRVWHKPPRVLSLEGLNPLVLGGQWLPDVKAAAGAVDASGQQPGDHPARITWQQVSLMSSNIRRLVIFTIIPVWFDVGL
jgi:hypothetical protein